MSLASGTRLGPYEITAPLGSGGMGEVYRARDTRLDRVVAIKVLPATLARDAEFRARFDREARAISRLTHPHICALHDVGHQNDVAFLVLELVDGETLGQWLARNPRLPVERVLEIAVQIGQALAAAHAAGIVHRDVKPQNVVVSRDGYIKVLDFGVAKLLDRGDVDGVTMAPAQTEAGLVVGTTKYMSPEQARGLPVDARSDVFSFGILFYEMLAGRAPFDEPTATDTVVAILERQPPAITQYRSDIPGSVQRILAKCLEKPAERRYSSARELVSDLERARTESTAQSTAAKPARSIAVLPFVNMSNDPENEYFCDGIAEDLIGALTKIEQLRVVARTSAFSFKGKNADLREVGRVLNVGTVLEGSVRKAGNRLRVSAQLVNVADGYQLWSERFDRQLEDVFAIQDEISLAIVNALRVKLLGEDKAAVVKRHTDNVEAYQLYLKGRHHWKKWNEEGFARSKEYMERAIALDPDYALAHFGVADVYLARGAIGLISYRDLLPPAKASLTRALALDPELPEAWTLMSVVHMYEWDWTAAIGASTRAIELNPRLSHAYMVRALNHFYAGRADLTLEDAKQGVDLDPLALHWHVPLVDAYIARGEYEEASKRTNSLLELDPKFWWAHFFRGQIAVARAQYPEARRCFDDAARYSGAAPLATGLAAFAAARSGAPEEARRMLAALVDSAKLRHVPALGIAVVYAGLREADHAFEWLDRSFEEEDVFLIGEVIYFHHLDELRGDPRMNELRRKLARKGVRVD